jgi:flagellar biosynthetic protein FliR
VTAVVPLDQAAAFALAMVRLLALFLVAPVFSHSVVPMRVRAALAFATTWATADLWSGAELPLLEVGPALAAVAHEALVGATLGFATGLVFSGIALLGEFASIQGGLGAATVLDPTSGASSVVLTSLTQVFAIVVFLALDGHHVVLHALLLSFEGLPLGGSGATLDPEVFSAVASLGALIFEVAVRLAAPITAVMLLSNVAVGMLGRAIPQLNLMALQLPAHIGLTLLILGLAAGPFTDAMAETLSRLTERAIGVTFGMGNG